MDADPRHRIAQLIADHLRRKRIRIRRANRLAQPTVLVVAILLARLRAHQRATHVHRQIRRLAHVVKRLLVHVPPLQRVRALGVRKRYNLPLHVQAIKLELRPVPRHVGHAAVRVDLLDYLAVGVELGPHQVDVHAVLEPPLHLGQRALAQLAGVARITAKVRVVEAQRLAIQRRLGRRAAIRHRALGLVEDPRFSGRRTRRDELRLGKRLVARGRLHAKIALFGHVAVAVVLPLLP